LRAAFVVYHRSVAASSLALVAYLLAQFAGATVPDGRPALQISNGIQSQRRGDPVRRTVMTHRVDLETSVSGEFGAFAHVTWVQLFDSGLDQTRLHTSQVGNVAAGFRHELALGQTGQWGGDVGLAVVLDVSRLTIGEPGSSISYAHALAMHGAWEAWLWAQGRTSLAFPGRLTLNRPWGSRPGEMEMAFALALFLPRSDLLETRMQAVLQLGASYTVWLRPWLSINPRLRTVWMPSAGWWQTQSSLGALLAAAWGRWRVGGEYLANLDAPYGWLPGGQRIAAFYLHLGLWL
jgi:hypothetical protein